MLVFLDHMWYVIKSASRLSTISKSALSVGLLNIERCVHTIFCQRETYGSEREVLIYDGSCTE